MELFSGTPQQQSEPLAYRMRPRTLDEFVGQEHIIGKGRLLRRAIQADQLSSVIFYGPPGTGKTALARVIANTTRSRFTTLNAVLSGVKELREEIREARDRLDLHGTRTILFIDEVHRWNKAQQDALLPWVENGTVILIGATTENPFFEVNSALVSRSRIFQLTRLAEADLYSIVRQALEDRERGYGRYRIRFTDGALDHLVHVSGGDARSLLNALQLAVETTPEQFPPHEAAEIVISLEAAEESIQQKVVLYDKEGDYHFDVISAFIKSIRGSDPDAVLYWLARMVRAGEDPRYIFRRMLISAGEDIGMADPHALSVVEAAASAFDRVGLPEGRFHLAQAALYLATAPKSNSSLGFFDALKAVEEEEAGSVPNHLKDASRDAEGFGHGVGYLYPHAYRDHWVAQQYLPTELQGRLFYRPSEQGYEKTVRESVLKRREAQLFASDEPSRTEILTFSPPDKQRDRWMQRLVSGRGNRMADIRERIFSSLPIARHDRILVTGTGSGMLLWEAARRVPEGGVRGMTASPSEYAAISRYLMQFSEAERPVVTRGELSQMLEAASREEYRCEFVLGMDLLLRSSEHLTVLKLLHSLISSGTDRPAASRQKDSAADPVPVLSLAQTIPRGSSRLSEFVLQESGELRAILRRCEAILFEDAGNPITGWKASDLASAAEVAGFIGASVEQREYTEQRQVSRVDLERWIHRSYSPAWDKIEAAGDEPFPAEALLAALNSTLCSAPMSWKSTVLFLTAGIGSSVS